MLFRINSFGERVRCLPAYLRYDNDDDGGGGGGGPTGVELDGETFNFPTATPVADMTAEQQVEYWRHESKKQQKKAPKKPADYDQLQADSAELARIRAEQMPKDERERQEAVDAARREGENIGAQRYLPEAIFGRLQAITGLDDDAVTAALEPVDANYFIDNEGNLDGEKLKKFAGSLGKGTAGAGNQPDPVRDALNRQKPAGSGGGGQSMSERREAARDRMTKKPKTTT